MDVTISKTTSDQLRYSQAVEAATAQHGEALADKVSKLIWGDEAPPVSLAMVVRALLALLQFAARALRSADGAYLSEAGDDAPSREERDEAAAALSALLVSVQHSIVGAAGEAYASKVGLSRALERRPDMLERRARRVVGRLRKVAPPEPRLEGVTVDIALLADRIEAGADRVKRALDSVATEKAELDAAYVAREQAAEHWERVVRLVANFMVGLAEVAGELAIAHRIRPTVRRLRGVLGGDELETDIVDDGDDDPDPNDPLVTGPTEPESGT